MITYKSSDILKRASQLADLENSSFISWNEQINLLNEAYRKLYQIVINNSDKYYLKTLKVGELVKVDEKMNQCFYYLPSDFYQLSAVTVGADKSRLMRKSPSESVASKRYEIINNQICFYGGSDANETEIEYFPIPQTLTTHAPDRKLEAVEDLILDCNNNGFLCVNEDGGVYVRNVAKGIETEPVEIGVDLEEIEFGLLGRKYAVVQTTDSVIYVDLIKKTFADISEGLFKLAKKDNEIYFFKNTEENIFNVYKESEFSEGTFRRKIADGLKITVPEGYDMTNKDVWTFSDGFFFVYVPYKETGDDLRIWECTSEEITPSFEISDPTKNTVLNGDLYTINYDLCCNGSKFISDADFYSLIGFNKADPNTGYGVTVLNDDNELVVKSVYTDTELSFPSNFYFNYMAYMLAVAYKTKQNADSSGLIALADAEEMAFYDTLNRDVSNTVRITNVYDGGSW
ncbi:MAG: hypothetical protein MJZ11_12810 [Lachnospiraceae bacterium]|nr:hypothetical protein [Lachnospiraceae bacterium]